MSPRALAALVASVAVAHAGWASAQAASAGTLRLEGALANARTLGVADLERCAQREVEVKARADGDAGAAPRRHSGCRVRDLVRAAEPVEQRPRDLRRSYLVATAADGYEVVFSWAEIALTPVGDDTIVALRRDGQPLREGEGPLAIVASADGGSARHVKDVRVLALRVAQR